MNKNMPDGKSADSCRHNHGVGCANYAHCAACGFNPEVEQRRKERVRAAERDGSLWKK